MNSSVYEQNDELIIERFYQHLYFDTYSICYCDGYLTVCQMHIDEHDDYSDEGSEWYEEEEEIDSEDDTLPSRAIITRTPTFSQVVRHCCAICMDSGTEHVSLSCGHWFHQSCIDRWRERSDTCPKCRAVPQMFRSFSKVVEQLPETIAIVNETAQLMQHFIKDLRSCFNVVGNVSTGFDVLMRIHAIANNGTGIINNVSTIWNVAAIIKSIVGIIAPVVVEKYYDSLDTFAEEEGLFDAFLASTVVTQILPAGMGKILDFMSRHSRLKFLTDIDGFNNSLHYVLSLPLLCLRKLEESSVFPRVVARIANYYEFLLSFLPGSLQNQMQKRAIKLITDFYKDASIVKTTAYVTEFDRVYSFFHESAFLDHVDDFRIPEGFKMIIETLKSIKRVLISSGNSTRTQPIWLYCIGPSGCGKTTFCKMIVDAMRDNYSVYCHKSTPGQKEFFDGYNCEDIFWEDDITTADQVYKYLNLVSSQAFAVDVADVGMKGIKKFSSSFLLSTSNKTIQELVKNTEHQTALLRRALVLDFSDVVMPGGVTYAVAPGSQDTTPTIRAYALDPVSGTNSVQTIQANHGVTWFDTEVFKALNANAAVKAAQGARAVQIPKRALPQAFPPTWITNLYTEMTTLDIVERVKELFPECSICRTSRAIIKVPLSCGHSMCFMCYETWAATLIRQRLAPTCPYCRAPMNLGSFARFIVNTHNFLGRVVLTLEDIYDDAKGFLTTFDFKQTFSSIANAMLSKEFLSLVAGTIMTSLIGVTIELFIERWFFREKEGKPEKTQEAYIAPRNNNVRNLPLETDSPIYVSSQGVYPGRETVEFPSNFERIRNNMLFCQFLAEEVQSECIGTMIDGYHLFVPAHVLSRKGKICDRYRVLGEDQEGAQLIAGVTMVIAYVDLNEDVAVLTHLNKTFSGFKSLASRFATEKCRSKEMFLITPWQCLPVKYPSLAAMSMPYFSFTGVEVKYTTDSVQYSYEAPGLCGALLCDADGFVLGFHVAYNQRVDKGISRMLRRSAKSFFRQCKGEGIDRKLSPVNGFVVESGIYKHVPGESSISKSDLYEVFPVERAPAVLKGNDLDGKSILKKSVEKNVKPVKIVNEKALQFAKYSLERLLGTKKSEPLTEREIVLGKTGSYSGIDKRSSAGIPYNCKNLHLFDFENGTIGSEVNKNIKAMKEEFKSGSFNINTIVFGDTLKDELRNIEKIYKPRLFAAGPIHYAVELKRLLCDLVSRVQKHRLVNGIMIGINPLGKEWDVFAKKMSRLGWRILPGDFENWDGGMCTSFQEEAIDVLSKLTYEPEYASWLLNHLLATTRAILGEFLLTTHSIPSGHFLTAFFNSIINEMYQAYAFYVLNPIKSDFATMYEEYRSKMFSAKYGDDLFSNIHESISEWFNCFTFTQVMKDIGVGFTAENKKPHEKAFYTLDECTFLKRSFVYSNKLKRVVGPLDRKTMLSTISYVSDCLRMEELVDLKVNNFQREAFLHPDYEYLMEVVSARYQQEYGFPPPILDDETLLNLYLEDNVIGEYAVPQSKWRNVNVSKWNSSSWDTHYDQAGIDVQILEEDGSISHLLVKGKDWDQGTHITRGKWGIPKGKVEPHESLYEAAIRECKEETGLVFSKWELFEETKSHSCTIFKVLITRAVFKTLKIQGDHEIVAIVDTLSPLSFELNAVSRNYFQRLPVSHTQGNKMC